MDQEQGAPIGSIDNEEEIPQSPTNFSNLYPSESTPLVNQPQQPHPRKNMRESVLYSRFKIEGEVW